MDKFEIRSKSGKQSASGAEWNPVDILDLGFLVVVTAKPPSCFGEVKTSKFNYLVHNLIFRITAKSDNLSRNLKLSVFI